MRKQTLQTNSMKIWTAIENSKLAAFHTPGSASSHVLNPSFLHVGFNLASNPDVVSAEPRAGIGKYL